MITLNRQDSEKMSFQCNNILYDEVSTVIEKTELEAVFDIMIEGVIVVDPNETIVNINNAAQKLFRLDHQIIIDKPFLDVIQNSSLLRLTNDVFSAKETLEDEIIIRDVTGEKMFLQVHGIFIQNQKTHKQRVLIILNDVTKLRRLENIRSDFVANVSHELKTPITTIKGFVETLREGGIEDPHESQNFLDIVLRNADRLHAIVEDLLTLSRIEEEDNNSEIFLTEERVVKPLIAAIEACAMKATEKNIQILLKCDGAIRAPLNSPLMEQAISNLIVNAIKYTEAGNKVLVRAIEENPRTILIEVEDFGIGIDEKHLPRLFERFYRSDKARSRKLGGTGLGLAIVKHIVMAHHGRVGVRSVLKKGTTFMIRLPRHRVLSEDLGV